MDTPVPLQAAVTVAENVPRPARGHGAHAVRGAGLGYLLREDDLSWRAVKPKFTGSTGLSISSIEGRPFPACLCHPPSAEPTGRWSGGPAVPEGIKPHAQSSIRNKCFTSNVRGQQDGMSGHSPIEAVIPHQVLTNLQGLFGTCRRLYDNMVCDGGRSFPASPQGSELRLINDNTTFMNGVFQALMFMQNPSDTCLDVHDGAASQHHVNDP
jgi:hypothetical protein